MHDTRELNGWVDAQYEKEFAAALEGLMNAFDLVEHQIRATIDGATKENRRSIALRVVGLMRGRTIDV